MKCIDVWDHPELFKDFDFSILDRKVKYIQRYRKKDALCDKIIKELNNRIDIDFIKDSEQLEGNTIFALQNIDFDEDFEELYETNIFDRKVKGPNIDDFYLGKYRTIIKDGALTIYRKDPETGIIKRFKCNMPTHLQALKDALAMARKEKELIESGIHPPVKAEFIEKLHETLFEFYIMINTRLNKDPNGPPVKPEGYGKFRKTIMINGKPHKYEVEVEGPNWETTSSDFVVDEMKVLIDKYNSSTLHPILKALIFKACMVQIHPFRDGNGRTSRLMLNYMLVRNGIPTVTIRGNHKDKYFSAMNKAIIDSDYSELVKMVTKELNQRCRQYVAIIDKLKLRSNAETDLNNLGL